MKYWVHIINTVSTVVEVEAGSVEEALDAWYDSPECPGAITVGAFGPNSVDDGDWEPTAITDESGAQVWSESES